MICFDSDGTVEEDLTVYHWDADDEKKENGQYGGWLAVTQDLEKIIKQLEEKLDDEWRKAEYAHGHSDEYNKAIDDFRNEVITLCKSHSVGADNRHENELLYAHEDGTWHSLLDDVTELLRAGKENVKKSHTGTDPD